MSTGKWDQRFLEIAKVAAEWSKDPKAKVGAVIVDTQGQVAAVGYNGFPKLVEDSAERLDNPDVKLELVVHECDSRSWIARSWRNNVCSWKTNMRSLRRLHNTVWHNSCCLDTATRRNRFKMGR